MAGGQSDSAEDGDEEVERGDDNGDDDEIGDCGGGSDEVGDTVVADWLAAKAERICNKRLAFRTTSLETAAIEANLLSWSALETVHKERSSK